jgi:hypothetical protein
MDIVNNRWNKSTIFILPLLYPDIKFTDVLQENFINCYISDVILQEPQDSLIIEFDNNIARFKFPEDKLDDYSLIKRSKYSKISNSSKQNIIYFWEEDKDSYLYSILYKTKKVLDYWAKKSNTIIHPSKEKEYWPKFNLYEETRGISSLYKQFNFNLIE